MKLWLEEPCPHGRWVTSPACQLLMDDGTECPGASSKQATTLDLVAAIQEEGGEIVEAVFSDDESVPSIPVTREGPYLVVRIEGEES